MEAQILLGSKITSLQETSLQNIPNNFLMLLYWMSSIISFSLKPLMQMVLAVRKSIRTSYILQLQIRYLHLFHFVYDTDQLGRNVKSLKDCLHCTKS
ncbi:hypothetical protein HYC85_006378 [Camellia sinensis]|uniref:Uncharacterized protein n=1 Tax=Camellia sinensis TaxID=4442 RepID=A0A7J7HKT7_CAMSI|nr:hypothetical protein HYC85_006378 [Camellia sinensis]